MTLTTSLRDLLICRQITDGLHNLNTHSTKCIPPVAAVPELLHGPIHSHQTSQIKFSPISRGGMNWSVCRV